MRVFREHRAPDTPLLKGSHERHTITMTTTVERFYGRPPYDHEAVHLEENDDLTCSCSRCQRDAEHAGLVRRLHPSTACEVARGQSSR
jgi:hypothetical protein